MYSVVPHSAMQSCSVNDSEAAEDCPRDESRRVEEKIQQIRKETIERIFGTAKEQHGF